MVFDTNLNCRPGSGTVPAGIAVQAHSKSLAHVGEVLWQNGGTITLEISIRQAGDKTRCGRLRGWFASGKVRSGHPAACMPSLNSRCEPWVEQRQAC